MHRWVPSRLGTLTRTNFIRSRNFATFPPRPYSTIHGLLRPAVSAPALPSALGQSVVAFSNSAYRGAESNGSGKTKEELIEELKRDPEAILILEGLKKEFDASNKTNNHENSASVDADNENTNMSNVEATKEQSGSDDPLPAEKS